MTVKRTQRQRRLSRTAANATRHRASYYLLQTSRYDLLHDWNKTVTRLKLKDREALEEDFSIFLEDWPQLKHRFTSKEILQDVKYSTYMHYDILHCITYTHTVIVWRFKYNAREIHTERILFPCTLAALVYIHERRVYVALDQNANLLMMAFIKSRDRWEVMIRIDNVYNATCLAYIKDTKQVVLGGVGYLKFYAILSGKEISTKISKAKDIATSLGRDECIRDLYVDPNNHRLNVMTHASLIMVDYKTMTEIRRFREEEGSIFYITCCCVYRNNEYLITGNSMGVIRVWNPLLLTEIHVFKGHRDFITAVKTSWAKALLVSASSDGWVFIWRLDVFRGPLQKTRVDETIHNMGLTSEHNSLGIWCFTDNGIVVYEYNMFSIQYAYMDSTVYKLQRILGHDDHPNRILVGTEDGGLRHLNPVTGTLIGYMFPMTSLHLVQKFAYNSIRRRTYLVMGEGSVLVLDCNKSPFRGVEVFSPSNPDDAVTCITGGLMSLGKGFEDIIIFAGYKNGQIHILASEIFTMPRPVQAHHAPVECLDLMAGVSAAGDVVYRASRAVVSAGADYAIKVWKLLCKPSPDVGLDIRLQLMVQIRCVTSPKFLVVTEDRVAVVYRSKNMLDMYDISETGPFKKPPRLTHTADYDHTHTVTSLQKCPLLRIFATSSLDCTIKVWDDHNELVRELIFLTPIVDCCFASDIGDLLSASGTVIRLTSPEKYLPWAYLVEMERKSFPTTEYKEMELEYQVSLKSWIDPSRVRKLSLSNRQSGWQSAKMKRQNMNTEAWEMTWHEPQGRKVHITVPVPVRHRRRQAPSQEGEDVEALKVKKSWRQPRLSVVFPLGGNLMMGDDKRRKPSTATRVPSASVSRTSTRAYSASSSEVGELPREQASRQSSDLMVIKEEKSREIGEGESDQGEEGSLCISIQKRKEDSKEGEDVAATVKGKRAASEDMSQSGDDTEVFEGISLAEKKMLEGLGVVSSLPKSYNILRSNDKGRMGCAWDSPVEIHGDAVCVAEEEEEEDEEEDMKRRSKETLRDYMQRRGLTMFSVDLDSSNRRAVLETMDVAIADVEADTDIEANQRRFLLSFGRKFRQALVEREDIEPDELADQCFRDIIKRQKPVMPNSVARARDLTPIAPESTTSLTKTDLPFLERMQRKVAAALEAEEGSEAAKWLQAQRRPFTLKPMKITRKIKWKKVDSFRDSTQIAEVHEDFEEMVPGMMEAEAPIEEELEEGLKQVRQQSWFPSDIPQQLDPTCQAWIGMMDPSADFAQVRTVAVFTAEIISSGKLSEAVQELVLDALQKLISALPVEQAMALLSELANILDPDILRRIAEDLYTHYDEDIRARMRQLGKVSRYQKANRNRKCIIKPGPSPEQIAGAQKAPEKSEDTGVVSGKKPAESQQAAKKPIAQTTELPRKKIITTPTISTPTITTLEETEITPTETIDSKTTPAKKLHFVGRTDFLPQRRPHRAQEKSGSKRAEVDEEKTEADEGYKIEDEGYKIKDEGYKDKGYKIKDEGYKTESKKEKGMRKASDAARKSLVDRRVSLTGKGKKKKAGAKRRLSQTQPGQYLYKKKFFKSNNRFTRLFEAATGGQQEHAAEKKVTEPKEQETEQQEDTAAIPQEQKEKEREGISHQTFRTLLKLTDERRPTEPEIPIKAPRETPLKLKIHRRDSKNFLLGVAVPLTDRHEVPIPCRAELEEMASSIEKVHMAQQAQAVQAPEELEAKVKLQEKQAQPVDVLLRAKIELGLPDSEKQVQRAKAPVGRIFKLLHRVKQAQPEEAPEKLKIALRGRAKPMWREEAHEKDKKGVLPVSQRDLTRQIMDFQEHRAKTYGDSKLTELAKPLIDSVTIDADMHMPRASRKFQTRLSEAFQETTSTAVLQGLIEEEETKPIQPSIESILEKESQAAVLPEEASTFASHGKEVILVPLAAEQEPSVKEKAEIRDTVSAVTTSDTMSRTEDMMARVLSESTAPGTVDHKDAAHAREEISGLTLETLAPEPTTTVPKQGEEKASDSAKISGTVEETPCLDLSAISGHSINFPTPSTGQVPPTTPSASFAYAEKPDLQQILPVMQKLEQERQEMSSQQLELGSQDFKGAIKYKRLSFLSEKYDPVKSSKKEKEHGQPGLPKDRRPFSPRDDKTSANDMGQQEKQGLKWHWKVDRDRGQFYKFCQPVALWNSKTLSVYQESAVEKSQYRAHQQKDQRLRSLIDENRREIQMLSSNDIEASARLVKKETGGLSLMKLTWLRSDYPWMAGEAGLRVARGVTMCTRKRPSVSKPPDPIMALQGRLGMMTMERDEGISHYGKMSLLWTTKVPRIPVSGLSERVRQLEEMGPHHRRAVSRVPPFLARPPTAPAAVPVAAVRDGVGGAREERRDDGGGVGGGRFRLPHTVDFPSDVLASSADQKDRVKLHRLVSAGHKRVKDEKTTIPCLLQHSSFGFLPSPLQNDVLRRLRYYNKLMPSNYDAAKL